MTTKRERKLKEEENHKLPEEQEMGLKAKIGRALFVFLTSIGIVTSYAYNVKHGEIDKNVKMESNIDREKRNRFIKSLKTVTSNESIIDEVIENRR